MKPFVTSLLTMALQLPSAQGVVPPSPQSDVRVLPDKPAVYITFEKRGAAIDSAAQRFMETNEHRDIPAGRDLWFRFHNNSRWTVFVRTASFYLDVKAFSARQGEPQLWTALADGMQVNLDYTVLDRDGRERPVGGHMGAISPLPPGRSVLFSVRQDSLPRDWSLVYVYFTYEWERGQQFSNNLGPEHRVGYWSFRLVEDEKRGR